MQPLVFSRFSSILASSACCIGTSGKAYIQERVNKGLCRILEHKNSLKFFSANPEQKPKEHGPGEEKHEANKKEEKQQTKESPQSSMKEDTAESEPKRKILGQRKHLLLLQWELFLNHQRRNNHFLRSVDLFKRFRIWMILRALKSIWGEELFNEELFLKGASSAQKLVFECLEQGNISSLDLKEAFREALGEEVYSALTQQSEEAKGKPHFVLKEIIDRQISNAFRYIDVPKRLSFVALDVEFLMQLERKEATKATAEQHSDHEAYYGITEVRFESPLSRVPLDPGKKIQIIKADFVEEPDWKLTRILK
eukprot:jgi/Galph1/295/GphlegSOOS_G5040.1